MSATATLMTEHQFILKYIELMERYTNLADTTILLSNAPQFIAFIHDFADHLHHAKEENILFRYLSEPSVLTHCNPIPQMLYEHNKAREYVQIMEKAITENDLTALATAIKNYATLLREHIYKEDHILYVMAERGLSETAKTNILEEYTETDKNLHSEMLWQHYQTLYNELIQQAG